MRNPEKTRDRDRKCYALRLQGLSWRAIGKTLGYSGEAARKSFHREELRVRAAHREMISTVTTRRLLITERVLALALDRWESSHDAEFGSVVLDCLADLTAIASGMDPARCDPGRPSGPGSALEKLERRLAGYDRPAAMARRFLARLDEATGETTGRPSGGPPLRSTLARRSGSRPGPR